MPVNLHRESKKGIYSHIYNKGIEKRIIFNDKEDYEVFRGYINDYLTTPKDPESVKKVFTVRGQAFRGTPHQSKNYFNKVELIAYSLMPDHFHMILHQITEGSIERFMRSLSTRYSMYFNKKYQRGGSLFEGPYKSIRLKDETHILLLTRYLHRYSSYSSYLEYLNPGAITFVRPKVVQSFFKKVKKDLFKGTDSYKSFVESYETDQKTKELIESVAFESEIEHLERRDPLSEAKSYSPGAFTESSKTLSDHYLKPLQRIPEFLGITVVFLLLLTLGMRNIINSSTNKPKLSTLGTNTVVSKTPSVAPKPTKLKAKIILTVNIADHTESINIRQKPTINSQKVGKAKNGDNFKFIAKSSGWYEVELADGSTGFISAKYIVEGKNE